MKNVAAGQWFFRLGFFRRQARRLAAGVPLSRRRRPHQQKSRCGLLRHRLFGEVGFGSGGAWNERGLRGLAALDEGVAADAAEEEKRGGNLAGLGD